MKYIRISYDCTIHSCMQIMSYTRGLLVRAVDPLTRGALRARVELLGSAVHLRSFLDGPEPPGHTIKGSGLVSFAPNRWNTTTAPIDYTLQRECDKHMRTLGVRANDYNFGDAKVLDATTVVSINGRRYITNICALLGFFSFSKRIITKYPHCEISYKNPS